MFCSDKFVKVMLLCITDGAETGNGAPEEALVSYCSHFINVITGAAMGEKMSRLMGKPNNVVFEQV